MPSAVPERFGEALSSVIAIPEGGTSGLAVDVLTAESVTGEAARRPAPRHRNDRLTG